MNDKTLEQYFRDAHAAGVIDHSLRCTVHDNGDVTVCVYPYWEDGDILEFLVIGDRLLPPPLTAEEADRAFDESPAIPMSEDEIEQIVERVVSADLALTRWRQYAAYLRSCIASDEPPMDFDAFVARSTGAGIEK